MNRDKALGPDRFPPSSFQTFWNIVGQDIHRVVEDSKKKEMILKAINHTFLALIPKKKKVTLMGEFKPTSLCNISYKIIYKVVSNRLKNMFYYFKRSECFCPENIN